MNLSSFDYELPPDRIAQAPAEPRDAARLLVHSVGSDRTQHGQVADLPEHLRAGDLLVVNDTRVRPARLLGRRPTGGGVELLLLEHRGGGRWRALARPAAKLKAGELLRLGLEGQAGDPPALIAEPLERLERGAWWVQLRPASLDPGELDGLTRSQLEALIEREIERIGRMPLPPYIRRARDDARAAEDRERYQTVYAREPGAAAAPTAGLHFTQGLLERLAAAGVERASVTLHVGEGTFRPVEVEDLDRHPMHAESVRVSAETVDAVERCRARGGRVVAVGTTSVRALESAVDSDGRLTAWSGETRLFLRPGDEFRVVDALMTNFHLPRSTLLMLVSAFAGRERTLRLYREAIALDYRFYSYGDAMLLTR